MARTPSVNSEGQKELEKVSQQFDQYKNEIETILDNRNVKGQSPEHEISQKDIEKSQEIYIKPNRVIMSKEKFNERYREQYNYAKEYVHYTVEHHECKGDSIEFWTKPFPGVAAEFWIVPSGKPVWIPRYVADKLEHGCTYRRLKTVDRPYSQDQMGTQYFGQLVQDEINYRISGRPVSTRKNFVISRPFARAN